MLLSTDDRRIRPRHPDRQHADRAPRRHVRPGAALPAARPRRPLEGARLRLFTLPADRKLTAAAERRLKVLQSLDTLGAGFQLASHDLDIRGAGNLLGEEQSGHISEVGFELYQQMLEEAVASAQGRHAEPVADTLVAADHARHAGDDPRGLRRRPAAAARRSTAASPTSRTTREIDAFGAELIDRFGPLPRRGRAPARRSSRSRRCAARANVEKVDAGPKGAVVTFRDNTFANPERLVAFIRQQGSAARVRPDKKVVFFDDWEQPEQRLQGHRRDPAHLVGCAARQGGVTAA